MVQGAKTAGIKVLPGLWDLLATDSLILWAGPSMNQLMAGGTKAFHQTLAGIDIGAALERRLEREGSADPGRGWGARPARVSDDSGDRLREGVVAMAAVICPNSCAGVPCRGLARGSLGTAGGARLADVYGRTSDSDGGGSFAAGRAIFDRLAQCDEKTLVVFLISGGGRRWSSIRSILRSAWAIFRHCIGRW